MAEGRARRFSGKVAIVTGGARGIGRGIALELAGEGAQVVIGDIAVPEQANQVVAEIAGAGGTAMAVHADVGLRADAEALTAAAVERFGRVDVLVNNAGVSPFYSFWEITDAVWDATMRTNLYGTFVVSQCVARAMRETGGGAIVHISSVSSYQGRANQVHYGASKGGINALTAAMAVALGPDNIRVNAVLPGAVPTDMNRQFWEDAPWTEPGLPVNRVGQPWDIARAVCFLASDDAAWLSGVLLPVDGGRLVRS